MPLLSQLLVTMKEQRLNYKMHTSWRNILRWDLKWLKQCQCLAKHQDIIWYNLVKLQCCTRFIYTWWKRMLLSPAIWKAVIDYRTCMPTLVRHNFVYHWDNYNHSRHSDTIQASWPQQKVIGGKCSCVLNYFWDLKLIIILLITFAESNRV